MARLPSDGDPYTTTNGMGTFGYAAPELGATGNTVNSKMLTLVVL